MAIDEKKKCKQGDKDNNQNLVDALELAIDYSLIDDAKKIRSQIDEK